MNILILGDALSVEFQSNELLDLSLNARLALGITEKETHPGQWVRTKGEGRCGMGVPRVSCRETGRWHVELLAGKGGTS